MACSVTDSTEAHPWEEDLHQLAPRDGSRLLRSEGWDREARITAPAPSWWHPLHDGWSCFWLNLTASSRVLSSAEHGSCQYMVLTTGLGRISQAKFRLDRLKSTWSMACIGKANVPSYQLPLCEYCPDCISQSCKGSMSVLQQLF